MTLTIQIVAMLLLVVANRFVVVTEFSVVPAELDGRLVKEFRFEARAGATETACLCSSSFLRCF